MMSIPVNLQDMPAGVFQEVFSPENVRGRHAGTSLTPLSFPKSRSALWDGSPVGEKLHLQLCSPRMPRILLREKALRLAQRHARHCNKSHVPCFFLGSLSVDADEEGVTVTLDRFDPGRDQAAVSGRVPAAPLPGDIQVPCLFSFQKTSDDLIQSEAELYRCFSVLQRYVSSRQPLSLSQLITVKGRVSCQQQADATVFTLSWSSICPSISLDVHPVRAIPIIPTALVRSLTSLGRVPPPHSSHQQGFLTMDQTRKLLLLLESDPKASKLPLVGLWLSGVTHVYNPQVWAWCLRFLLSSALQDRVLSENGYFLLVIFGSTHRVPQFFQCRGSDSGTGCGQPHCQLLSASQDITLYQVAPADGQTLQFELSPERNVRQIQVFRHAQTSFSSGAPPTAALSVSDHDSGVEDEDASPRPSPSPHLPAQQTRQVQPSVPELSLLIDSSFTSNHNVSQDTDSAQNPPPPKGNATSTSPPPHLHSTPNPNLPQPCTCCPPHTYDCTPVLPSVIQPPLQTSALPVVTPPSKHPAAPPLPDSASPQPCPGSCSGILPVPVPNNDDSPFPHPASPTWLARPCGVNGPQAGGAPCDAYQLLLQNDQQIRLLQAQVKMLLEAQVKLQGDAHTPKTMTSIAVATGASLFWGNQTSPRQDPPNFINRPHTPSSSSPSPASHDCSTIRSVGGAEDRDVTNREAPCPPSIHHSVDDPKAPFEAASGGESADGQQSFYCNLMTQLTSRLQESDSRQEEEDDDDDDDDGIIQQSVANKSTLVTEAVCCVEVHLRCQSHTQLSRLSMASNSSVPVLTSFSPTSSPSSSLFHKTSDLLSPNNMSMATREFMGRCGLIQDEDQEDIMKALPRQLLTKSTNPKLTPQSQLIRDLRPKMQLLVDSINKDKENVPALPPSLVQANSRQREGSVGNILDLSRLRQLPKLF
ncbi:SCL-interrupting locus protein homolog isoform X2 [Dunckerocampus dactyliophorus]|uniref:SCL-interrupting locus protein homolog isoform X2 n=1 Tax=Dunckerocampus dactyliophorus TaxID=161453 RepID=UPI0024056BE4|nr:SCL-interrupting locus protein homolog isoform X2 [Dunckerocampus dactyliophorus]